MEPVFNETRQQKPTKDANLKIALIILKAIGSKIMKTIRYELKSLGLFVIRRFLSPLDKILGPVII